MTLADATLEQPEPPTILIVEDENITAMDIRSRLLALGYRVAATVSSGKEALGRVETSVPDLVLMDIVLKGDIDGVEAARQIQSRFDIPVIYLTAFSDSATLQRARVTAPFGYILKPFDERDLHTTIEMALYKHRMERRFASIVEGTEAGYFRIGGDTLFEDVNAAWLKMHGYASKEEIVGRPFSMTQCDADAESATGIVERVLRGESIPNGEFSRKCKDGSTGHHSYSIQPVWRGGAIVGLEGFLIDITERKRSEQRVADALNYNQTMLETSPVGIATFKASGPMVSANEALARIVGATVEQVRTQNFRELESWKKSGMLYAAEKALATGHEQNIETYTVSTFGKRLWLSARFVRFQFDGEDHLMGLFTDVTERKRVDEAHKESVERQGLLLRSIPMMFYTARSTGEMETTWISDQVEVITGFPPSRFIKDTSFWSRRLHPDDRNKAVREYESILQKGSITNEYRWLCKDGTYHWFLDLTVLVHDGSGAPSEVIGAWLDITDRKETEQALVESRSRLTRLNECLLSFGPDPDENINRLVALCGEQLGGTAALYNRLEGGDLNSLGQWNTPGDYQPRDKANGHICYDVIHRKQSDACILRNLAGTPYAETDPNVRRYGLKTYVGKAVSFADSYVGSLCVVYDHDYAPSDEDLKLLGIAASAIGVEEKRKHAEEELRQSEHQYRLLFMENPHPMYVHDLETLEILAVNDAAINHYGFSRDEFLTMTIKDIAMAEDIPELLQRLGEMNGQVYSGVWRHRKRDGSIIIVETSSHGTVFAGRRARIMLAMDITARREAAEKIAMLGHTIRSISEAVSVTDLDNRIIFVNEAFRSLYGYRDAELIGKPIEIVRCPSDRIPDVPAILELTKKGGWHGELMNRKKDGTDFPVSLSTSVVYDDDGQAIALVGIAQDVTEQRQAELERANLEEQLRQAQKLQSLGTLAGGIAHDFNNILGIIVGHITLLGDMSHDHPKFKERLQAVAKAADRGAGLVRQLLTFARKADTTMEAIRINDSVREVSKLIAETFPKTVTLTTRLEAGLPPIKADSNQIHQVLVNLCVNARDAMPGGGELSITTKLVSGESIRPRFITAGAEEYVLVSVADSGIGMDETTRGRIFEPFFTTKPIGKGTGLGLAVVFGIVEGHNGFSEVTSEVGKGSCFHLYFPVDGKSGEMQERDGRTGTTVMGGSETILLVEDETDLLEMVESVLKVNGYRVLTAKDGVEAVRRYENDWRTIDLVVTDMGLPKLDGRGVLERMRTINTGLRAIIASGYVEPDVKQQILGSGAMDFLQKPYRPRDILNTVRTVLDRRDSQTSSDMNHQ